MQGPLSYASAARSSGEIQLLSFTLTVAPFIVLISGYVTRLTRFSKEPEEGDIASPHGS